MWARGHLLRKLQIGKPSIVTLAWLRKSSTQIETQSEKRRNIVISKRHSLPSLETDPSIEKSNRERGNPFSFYSI